MKINNTNLILALLIALTTAVNSFVLKNPCVRTTDRVRTAKASLLPLQQNPTSVEAELNDQHLEGIAHKFRLQVYDVDTGVYGFESKDPDMGIEVIHAQVQMDSNGWLGLDLTEVAHSDVDHRGLVLVSAVSDQQHHQTQDIQMGDTIVGVFVDDTFAESTTGLDYDETVRIINDAKLHATKRRSLEHGQAGKLTLELNRLVKRATVQVQIVDDNDNVVTELNAKAGDNLRTFLMHHNTQIYDKDRHRLDQPRVAGSNCGGEGICGTCVVAIQDGMEHLNKVGPQESTLLKGLPSDWRATCKAVIGADNVTDTILRVRLHPHATAAPKASTNT